MSKLIKAYTVSPDYSPGTQDPLTSSRHYLTHSIAQCQQKIRVT